jgi:hypothetical protein
MANTSCVTPRRPDHSSPSSEPLTAGAGDALTMTILDMPAWSSAWGQLPLDRREVYFHPAYASICAPWERARPGCLRLTSPAGWMLYPYLAHPIDGGACDAQTPYGYGGPLFVGEWSPAHKAIALARAAEFFRSTGAVAEFVRCHTEWSDVEALRTAGFAVFQVRTNVECDLTTGDDVTATWVSSARRNLRKAQAAGLGFRLGEGERDWAAFEGLYAATARRLEMAPAYRFDHDYFAGLCALAPVRLVVVESAGTPIAGAVVFIGGMLAHYHLGASDFAHQGVRPNDFLYFAMAEVARQAGCQRIVWGGGMSNDPADTLFRFKTHFGALRRPVFCAGRVIDRAGYDQQCAAWAAKNPGRESKLFLKYRA